MSVKSWMSLKALRPRSDNQGGTESHQGLCRDAACHCNSCVLCCKTEASSHGFLTGGNRLQAGIHLQGRSGLVAGSGARMCCRSSIITLLGCQLQSHDSQNEGSRPSVAKHVNLELASIQGRWSTHNIFADSVAIRTVCCWHTMTFQ